MSTLVIAEHDNRELKPATLNTVEAAKALGSDINLLVAGKDCAAVATAAANIPDVSKVYIADNEAYEHQLAENVSLLILSVLNADYKFRGLVRMHFILRISYVADFFICFFVVHNH